ncbi:PQQ-binding-like beta-propeller repeat protein [Streptomyces sp. NPDC042319]|uniref:outer membrane protein assembly factor BamB family protein n=1 Tax=Streptomyces sp. NPDC042319 TaxID=3154332 RepID=UPI0033D230E8
MNPLRQDDPRKVGPYHVVARLDPADRAADVPVQRFIARDGQGRTVVLCLPHTQFSGDLSYGVRFRAEAENSRRLTGPAAAAVVDIAPPGGPGTATPPWYAIPFEAALSLPGAVAAVGGPLPEATVRAVGAVLAETLATAHANGLVHAGISAENALITPEGPELTGYGLVRAAAVDGAARTALPGIPVSSLPPEQLSGGRPRPLGDVFALGSVLAYAALGRDPYGAETAEEIAERVAKGLHDLDGAPDELRPVLASCLAPDPADRPQMNDLLDRLLSGVATRGPGTAGGPMPALDASGAGAAPTTALDAGAGRSAAALVPGWLPGRVVAAMSQLAADVLSAETAVGVPAPSTAPFVHDRGMAGGPPGAVGQDTTRPGGPGGQPSVPASAASRRTLLTGVLAGAAGLALGAGGTIGWQAAAGGGPAARKKTDPLVAAGRARIEGVAPSPLWRYDIEGAAPSRNPVIWREEVVVVPCDEATVGLDLRTGKKLWERSELWPADDLQLMPGGLVLVPSLTLSAVEPRTGQVRWREKKYDDFSLAAAEGSTLWFTTPGDTATDLVAYDMTERREDWRVPLPEKFAGVTNFGGGFDIRPDSLLLSMEGEIGASNPPVEFLSLRRRDGSRQWEKKFKGVNSGMNFAVTSGGRLLSSTRETLRSIDIDTGKVKWTYAPSDGDGVGIAHDHGRTVYTSDSAVVCALDADTGKRKWRSAPESMTSGSPVMTGLDISPSGRSVFLNNETTVDVLDARSGKLLWRFADVIEGERGMSGDGRQIITGKGCMLIRDRASLYLLPLD